jgi:rare lipoprotein A (peptidoglycan hydrolase)
MRAILRLFLLTGLLGIGSGSEDAAAQSFLDRWSIIPKANAEPSPPQPDETSNAEPLAPRQISTKRKVSAQSQRPRQRQSRKAFAGKASFYSYAGGKTASGAPYNRNAMTAAHRSLPFGTRLRVSDPVTGKGVIVVINDRGPNRPDRVLDLSLGAARVLGITNRGVAHVRAQVL